MSRPSVAEVKRVACIGAGTIGSGWATVFLANGLDVIASDPGPDAESKMRDLVDAAWPYMETLGLKPGADRKRLAFNGDLASAVSDVDFVQESVPDDEALKMETFAQIDKAARPAIVIASSSSKFLPSRLCVRCQYPRRCIVGHPFVPAYLVPLVEVVGGPDTEASVMNWACDFYTAMGKKTIRLKREIEAYVANRLQHAVLEEMRRLVQHGICDYQDIDVAMTYGPGMRWAFAGPLLCYHLGGGRGGIRHMIDHFGWSADDKDVAAAINTVEQMAGHVPMDVLERWRDENLLVMLACLKKLPVK